MDEINSFRINFLIIASIPHKDLIFVIMLENERFFKAQMRFQTDFLEILR